MGERKRIALIFKYNEKWIGGTYYILNIVHALNTLPKELKPAITICAQNKDEFDYVKKETKYPFLSFFELRRPVFQIPFMKRVFNYFFRLVYKRNYFDVTLGENYLEDNFDLVFPNAEGYFYEKIHNNKKVAWVPDFQEAHLPEIFPVEMLINRKQDHIRIAYLAEKIVLSSLDAQKDFNTLYPFARCKQYVVPFAVTLPHFKDVDIELVKKKFGINRNYFYAPNQFWAHKNHKKIAESILILKEKHKDILVLFSGSEHDARTTKHIDDLRKFIAANKLEHNFMFLGFIDRADQLVLMDNAQAIIQPSLFEGWSTVIEDSKAMNQFVIASALDVHKEQIHQNVLFFDPAKAKELAECIDKVIETKPTRLDNNYKENIKVFALKFMDVIN